MEAKAAMRRRIAGLLVVLALVIVTDAIAAFLSPGRNDSPYRGKVVDDETGQPIRGAVVLAIWERERHQPFRISSVFYDARETLTDANGDWIMDAADIERRAPDRTFTPLFVMYAPGYFAWGPGNDGGSRLTGTKFSLGVTARVRPAESREERIRAMDSASLGIPLEKMPMLRRLVNEERTALGFQPHELPRGGSQ